MTTSITGLLSIKMLGLRGGSLKGNPWFCALSLWIYLLPVLVYYIADIHPEPNLSEMKNRKL